MSQDAFSLAGKVALVTGGGRGIGAAIAACFADAGARVLIANRSGDAAQSVAAGIREAGGIAETMACDIGQHAQASQAVAEAVRRFGAPTWMVTDCGTQFTAGIFTRALRRLGIGHRYGAVGRKGSISIIERFWRTMKAEHAHGLILFRPLRAIRARLEAYAAWFNEHRPHQGLAQRTPDEVHTGRSTRPRAVPLRAVLVAEHLAGDRDLPVLRLRRAA